MESYVPDDLYEDNNSEKKLDLSSKKLTTVPDLSKDQLLLLTALYLNDNQLEILTDDFFPKLPNLQWLDLRDNRLTELPKTICRHPSLSHILLQNNKLKNLPNELGTVINLKVLQLNGNPLEYPPKEVISGGTSNILSFLESNYFEEAAGSEWSEEDTESVALEKFALKSESGVESTNKKPNSINTDVSVRMFEKEDRQQFIDYFFKHRGKCPKLYKSRASYLIPKYCQSSKQLKPLRIESEEHMKKINENLLKAIATRKRKLMILKQEKVLQRRRNKELLNDWRQEYRAGQFYVGGGDKLDPKTFPYDINPEYMKIISREDIEKDLPDKYKKKLVRKAKPTRRRKNAADAHLALQIKRLFENLEAIDLNKKSMTPRTEQKVLMGEIHKMSEIKQKLMELTSMNTNSVVGGPEDYEYH